MGIFIFYNIHMLEKTLRRLRRKKRIRAKIFGTAQRPRLCVYRSNMHIYAQIIDDEKRVTLCSAHDLLLQTNETKTQKAIYVGKEIAKKALWLNITKVVFDRGGRLYHGRIKALADAARQEWLQF